MSCLRSIWNCCAGLSRACEDVARLDLDVTYCEKGEPVEGRSIVGTEWC
jgi:hypothetical protein